MKENYSLILSGKYIEKDKEKKNGKENEKYEEN